MSLPNDIRKAILSKLPETITATIGNGAKDFATFARVDFLPEAYLIGKAAAFSVGWVKWASDDEEQDNRATRCKVDVDLYIVHSYNDKAEGLANEAGWQLRAAAAGEVMRDELRRFGCFKVTIGGFDISKDYGEQERQLITASFSLQLTIRERINQ